MEPIWFLLGLLVMGVCGAIVAVICLVVSQVFVATRRRRISRHS